MWDYGMVHSAKRPGAFSMWQHDPIGAAAAVGVDTRWGATADTILCTFRPSKALHAVGRPLSPVPTPRHWGRAPPPLHDGQGGGWALALGENTNQLAENTTEV